MSTEIIDNKSVDISTVNLPSEAVKGLVKVQLDEMKRNVVLINQNMQVAGRAMRQAMEDLYNIKVGILGSKKKSNWIAFLESGALNISSKTARDLVAAYDKWIMKEGETIPDYVFSNMTARTLAVVADLEEESKQAVLAIVRGGGTVTEAEARRLSSKTSKRADAQTVNKKEAHKKWDDYCDEEIEKLQQNETINQKDLADRVRRIERKKVNMKKIDQKFAKIKADIASLQKLAYETVEDNNKFQKGSDPFLTKYIDLLKEKKVDVVDMDNTIGKLTSLRNSIDTIEYKKAGKKPPATEAAAEEATTN